MVAIWYEGGFDLLLTPTLGRAAAAARHLRRLRGRSDRARSSAPSHRGAFTALFNATGQPAISLPLHWTEDGLPIGVQLVAPLGREDLLLRVAAQLERAAPVGRAHARRLRGLTSMTSSSTDGAMISGVITAMVTPFADDRRGRPRRGAARSPRAWSSTARTALVVAGTTGESPTLSDDEKLALLRRVQGRGRRRGDR